MGVRFSSSLVFVVSLSMFSGCAQLDSASKRATSALEAGASALVDAIPDAPGAPTKEEKERFNEDLEQVFSPYERPLVHRWPGDPMIWYALRKPNLPLEEFVKMYSVEYHNANGQFERRDVLETEYARIATQFKKIKQDPTVVLKMAVTHEDLLYDFGRGEYKVIGQRLVHMACGDYRFIPSKSCFRGVVELPGMPNAPAPRGYKQRNHLPVLINAMPSVAVSEQKARLLEQSAKEDSVTAYLVFDITGAGIERFTTQSDGKILDSLFSDEEIREELKSSSVFSTQDPALYADLERVILVDWSHLNVFFRDFD